MNIVVTTIKLQKYLKKYLKISIGTIIKNLKVLRLVPDHLKTKEICNNAVTKLRFIFRYVPDQYKTREMYDKVILENGGTLMFVTSCYKNQKLCDKAVDTCLFYLILFLINIRLKKCVIKLFPKNLSW